MLAGNAETPHPKAADEDKLGADSERLESVGGRSNSRIEHDLVQIWLAAVRCCVGTVEDASYVDLVSNSIDNLLKSVKRGDTSVDLSASVV